MIFITVVGNVDKKMAIAFKDAVLKLMNMNDWKVNILIDQSRAGRQSSVLRNVWQELSEHGKLGEIAFLNLNIVRRIVEAFIIKILNKNSMLYFNKKEEAVEWLKK